VDEINSAVAALAIKLEGEMEALEKRVSSMTTPLPTPYINSRVAVLAMKVEALEDSMRFMAAALSPPSPYRFHSHAHCTSDRRCKTGD
jgi:hypothetical protein